MIKRIVREMKVKTVCDIYTCLNMAKYAIGHELMPGANLHVCENCMKNILDYFQKDENNCQSGTNESSKIEDKKEKKEDFYECPKCGQKFLRPKELNKYKAHLLKCKKETEE